MFKSKPKNKLTKRSKSEKSASKLTKVRKPPQNWRAGTPVGQAQPGATLLGGARVDRSADSESDDTGPTTTTTKTPAQPDGAPPTVAQQQGWAVATSQGGQRAQGSLLGQRPAQPTVVQPPITTAPPPTSTSTPAPLTGQQKAKAKAQNKGKHALMAFKPGSANTVDLAGLADNSMAVLQLQIAQIDLDTAAFVASAMQAVGTQQMPIKDFTDAIPQIMAVYQKVRDIGDDEAADLGQTATSDVEVALAMRTRKLLQDELANLVLKAERVQVARCIRSRRCTAAWTPTGPSRTTSRRTTSASSSTRGSARSRAAASSRPETSTSTASGTWTRAPG